jgi:hypothetical protein
MKTSEFKFSHSKRDMPSVLKKGAGMNWVQYAPLKEGLLDYELDPDKPTFKDYMRNYNKKIFFNNDISESAKKLMLYFIFNASYLRVEKINLLDSEDSMQISAGLGISDLSDYIEELKDFINIDNGILQDLFRNN